MRSRVWSLFFLLLILTGAAGTVLVFEDRKARELPSAAESFQKLVGGLGFGPAVDLGDDPSEFDPRLEGSCSMDYGPIAGGACFRPRQGSSILFYPPLKRDLHSEKR